MAESGEESIKCLKLKIADLGFARFQDIRLVHKGVKYYTRLSYTPKRKRQKKIRCPASTYPPPTVHGLINATCKTIRLV